MIPFEVQDTASQPGGSPLLDRILSRLRNTLQSLKNVVTNDHLVTVTLTTTPSQVFHGLNAPPKTIEVVGSNAGEMVFESEVANAARSVYVIMQATGDVNVTLRFT